jgi:hypothetical protein
MGRTGALFGDSSSLISPSFGTQFEIRYDKVAVGSPLNWIGLQPLPDGLEISTTVQNRITPKVECFPLWP